MTDDTAPASAPLPKGRPILRAVLLAVGSELTNGETRDTNSGDLARSLTQSGVEVAWISSLPDRLETVTRALREALAAAELVVTTGGLGPTPDDLTREAIAAVVGERPAVDPELERWLRHLFERRGLPFPETNVKQAWLIHSAEPLPNDRGTAPGWLVRAAEGRLIVALPGPPAEMRAMWELAALPRLRERGLGRDQLVVTYRLVGIGESMAAALLGEALLRAANPVVATYAKADGVDVRICAVAEPGRSPEEVAAPAREAVTAALGRYVWGSDGDTWPAVLGRVLEERHLTLALAERGTGGSTAALLGSAPWLVSAESSDGSAGTRPAPVAEMAADAARRAGTPVGLAVRAREAGQDTTVEIAAWGPWGVRRSRQTAFLGGADGRRRAAVAGAAFLNAMLGEAPGPGRVETPKPQPKRPPNRPRKPGTGAPSGGQ